VITTAAERLHGSSMTVTADQSEIRRPSRFTRFQVSADSQVLAATTLSAPTQTTPLTGHGTILGTLQYMAPEQLEGNQADARTDIWALGLVLYEMLTGERAFNGQTQASLIAAILERRPTPITSINQLTPPALDRLVLRCLARYADERWEVRTILAMSSGGSVKRPRLLLHRVTAERGSRLPRRLRSSLSARCRARWRSGTCGQLPVQLRYSGQ
jgi:serine/threonine protein kinase